MLEALAIYSACKCGACPGVKYRMGVEKGQYGKVLYAPIVV